MGERESANVTPAAMVAQLIVLVRNLAQLEAVMEGGVRTVYCEFEDPKKYREAVAKFRSSKFHKPESTIWVAPPQDFQDFWARTGF